MIFESKRIHEKLDEQRRKRNPRLKICKFVSCVLSFFSPALSTPFRWITILSPIKRVLLEHRDAARGVLMRDMGERETSSSRSCQQKYRHLSVVYCVCIYDCVCVCMCVSWSVSPTKGKRVSQRP